MIPWRREPTPICWPGGFHGLYSPWGGKESDPAEQLSLSLSLQRQHWETTGEDDKDRVDDDEVVMRVAIVIKVTIENSAIAILLKVVIALLCARC